MKKILVIDDEKDMLFVIQSILERKGFAVVTNDSGDINEIKESASPPDLILLDINIGEKNGGDICVELKSDQRTKQIPIILVSGEKEIREVQEECGAEDYLAKPFNFNQLLSKINDILKAA